tara:strand:+ start:6864 stop:7304 length:441 start_codon:yes stop_codon:yes gene_type:complete
MGLHWQFGVVAGAAGAPALAISMGDAPDPIVFEGVIGEDFPMSTSAGDIDLTVTATGGDGAYSYSWSVTEGGDDNNINTGNIRLTDAGTQNTRQYDDSIISAFDTGLSAGGPPIEALYQYACTVTDGTGATVSDSIRVNVIILADG